MYVYEGESLQDEMLISCSASCDYDCLTHPAEEEKVPICNELL